MLIIISTINMLEIHQINIKINFLNGDLKKRSTWSNSSDLLLERRK
jgi:hypothetical protein